MGKTTEPSNDDDRRKMVKISIDGLLKDKKELKPFPISIIKLATRLMPNILLNLGHKEFKAIKKLQNNEIQKNSINLDLI